MERKPLIFDIKRATTADGEGLRTAIFFKGCNLDCFWCHNPEGKSPHAELALFAEKCTGCGVCKEICAHKGDCTLCGACVAQCHADARRIYGKSYTVSALMEIILADKPFFDATGGGVTFSGGECMLYPEFVAALGAACHEKGITVAIDTAGNVPYEAFETVLSHADIFLYDIKCLDPALHKRGTGVDNARILANLEALCRTGKKIVVRIPEIPDFNKGEEVERIKEYCRARALPFEVLPYHAMGEGKKCALLAART